MGKRICVVGCDLGPEPMNYLREQFPEFEFLGYPRNAKVPDEVLASAEVLMNYGDKSQIAPAKNVKYIHTISAGIDGYIDEVDRCHGSSLPVSNGAGVYADAVGEHVIALLMAVMHGIPASVENMKEKKWPFIPMLKSLDSVSGILFLQQPDGAPWRILVHEQSMIKEVVFDFPEEEFRKMLADSSVILPGEPGFAPITD